MTEKPLHVRVAEALGWTHIHPRLNTGYPPEGPINGHPALPAADAPRLGAKVVPNYDIDWSATGPLIELLKLELHISGDWTWIAQHGVVDAATLSLYGDGRTPLAAVCELILRLSEAGKLPR